MADASQDRGSGTDSGEIVAALLAWYDRDGRRLPWRAAPGSRPDPYRVWLSEVMLQQTTTAAVAPYYHEFLERWPDVHDLAVAPQEEVLAAWAGLGYYARARNLHRCAQVVSRDHGGAFPDSEAELRKLPGIGPYTAAAVAAIAFDRPAAPLDGNIERVVARLFGVEAPLPGAKEELRARMAALVPQDRPGDFAQAMMDLGATVCLPAKPKCMLCPLAGACRAYREGKAESLPVKAAKKAKPTRRAVAFWTVRDDGAVLLRRRPQTGLLGGMTEVPTSDWREAAPDPAKAQAQAPLAADWQALPGVVRHTFTHFHFEIAVWAARVPEGAEAPGAIWTPFDRLGAAGLPTVMRKIAAHAVKAAAGASGTTTG